jgi:Domain of unknown function (DUF4304)
VAASAPASAPASERSAQEKFKELLTNAFAPWLKGRGFKRRATTFRRQRGSGWQIVNFQRSQHADARDRPFTINLGVSLDVLHESPQWRARGWPLEYECDFRQRIGPLHTGEDHWWNVRPLRPTRPVVKDVLAALEKGLAWLDAHGDAQRVLRDAQRDPSQVNALNLASLVALARQVGTQADVDGAERELHRWHQGRRSVF